MAIEQEIEFKQLLNRSTYDDIKATYFQAQQPFSQINFYIDTPDFQIQSQKMALRIRLKSDAQSELTLKVPAEVGLTEYNASIDLEPVESQAITSDLLSPDIKAVLQEYNVDVTQLHVLGSLKTYRYETQLKDGLLVLDYSQYLNTEDYELEFEVAHYDTGLSAFKRILQDFNLEHHPPKNKVQRFFERKHHLDQGDK